MKLISLLSALVLSLSGCVQTGSTFPQVKPERITANVLYSGSHCGGTESSPSLRWLVDLRELTRLHDQRFNRSMHSGAFPAVDFSRRKVLYIAMGQQPTAGYQLDYQSGSAELRGETLEVRVDWREPPPGYMVAQVITSPCLMLTLPRVSVNRVRVLDLQGQVRLESSV